MKPMPKEIAERWSPMWGGYAHSERPWWCAVHAQVADGPRVRWRRGDGVYTSYYKVPVTWGANYNPGTFFIDTPRSELEYIDGVHPLSAPPRLAGQVWAWTTPDGQYHERVIWGVSGPISDLRADAQAAFEVAPPDAVLVAGPTPWGMNVPWSPA